MPIRAANENANLPQVGKVVRDGLKAGHEEITDGNKTIRHQVATFAVMLYGIRSPHHGIIISEANRRITRNREEINEVRGVQR